MKGPLLSVCLLLSFALLPAAPLLGNQVIINEIMYHPSPAVPEDSSQEWIELFNKGTNAVNLTGWQLRRGIGFTFPNVSVSAGGYLVVAANVTSFHIRYPSVANV